jgi:DNA-binding NtrC family response regulator
MTSADTERNGFPMIAIHYFAHLLRGPMPEKKILLIDDDESVLEAYALLLEEHGYLVVTADCGRKALEEFFSQPFDLVITDLTMPDIDGFAVIEEVKNNSPDTPVITFTGNGHGYKSVKIYVTLLGSCALLEKSCSTEAFISCVRNVLETRA